MQSPHNNSVRTRVTGKKRAPGEASPKMREESWELVLGYGLYTVLVVLAASSGADESLRVVLCPVLLFTLGGVKIACGVLGSRLIIDGPFA